MKEYKPYVDSLGSFIDLVINAPNLDNHIEKIDHILNGQPADELRKLVSLSNLRKSGAYFTGSNLANIALESILPTIDDKSVILDPACGTGDLLLACSSSLKKKANLESTIAIWNKQIIGRDIFNEFINVAKARLLLKAIRSGLEIESFSRYDPNNIFPQIKQASGLENENVINKATHIVLNPPFTMVEAPYNCTWTTGKVNYAALFTEYSILHSNPRTRILAILPDVLRSGSRYKKWREFLTDNATIHRIELYGQFSKWADVDVFILDLEISKIDGVNSDNFHWYKHRSRELTIGDLFEVSVGSVVDYRDPKSGPIHPFVKPKNLPSWESLTHIDDKRAFEGKKVSPPFVVVRRTSRYGDKYRAIGTIINTPFPVVVENHLLVLEPKDRDIETCEKLLEVLQHKDTRTWLNDRIRCRHLTVFAVSEVPWWIQI